MEAFAFIGGDHGPHNPLCRHPKRLFVQGRAPAFVSASHLNDKDALVGSAGVAPSPGILCHPPAGCGGLGEKQTFLCVPTSGGLG